MRPRFGTYVLSFLSYRAVQKELISLYSKTTLQKLLNLVSKARCCYSEARANL